MTITTETLDAARQNFWARLTAKLPALANAPQNGVARALSDSLAGAFHQTRAAIPLLATECHPATATAEHLDEWADTYGLTRKPDESDADLRERLHERIRNQTSIGTLADWRYWASLLPEVTRAKVTAVEGEIAVGIYYDDRASPAPTAADITAAELTLRQYLPAGAEIRVYGMTSVNLTITLTNLNPDTATTRANATAAIADILKHNQKAGETVQLALLYQALSLAGVTASITAPAGDATPANATDIYTPVVGFA